MPQGKGTGGLGQLWLHVAILVEPWEQHHTYHVSPFKIFHISFNHNKLIILK